MFILLALYNGKTEHTSKFLKSLAHTSSSLLNICWISDVTAQVTWRPLSQTQNLSLWAKGNNILPQREQRIHLITKTMWDSAPESEKRQTVLGLWDIKSLRKISAIPWTVSHNEPCLGVTVSFSTLLLTDFYQLNNLLTNTSKPTASELPDLAFCLLQIVPYLANCSTYRRGVPT